MGLTQVYELGNDGEMRLLLGMGGPPRAGRITAVLGGNRYTVEIADSEESAVTASALNGAVYAGGDVVYVLQAENAPDSGVIIGRIGAVAGLGVGTATPVRALDVTGATFLRGGVLTAIVNLDDDAIIDLRSVYGITGATGFLLIHSAQITGHYALISFRAAALTEWCVLMATGSATPVVVGTTALPAGTTGGTDGRINVAATASGVLQVKNRMGGTRRFDIMVFA